MPKSTKKKKDKAADFAKAKLKLGKGKQVASNVVDTSFKARSIALPTQSIALEQDGDAPSTRRKLTFDALISHLKHYNASTRRDAILGLRELLESHPGLLHQHATSLINSCVRLIGDEDASVRKGLLSFFNWVFRQISKGGILDDLLPHSPVLLLFTMSAQTHIFPEIRIDAIRFLDVLFEYIPEAVVDGWTRQANGSHGRKVLEGYLGILSAGTTFGEGGETGPIQATSTASVVLSTASKLVVLRSLSTFLEHAIRSSNVSTPSLGQSSTLETPTWYFASSFATTPAFEAFDSLLRPQIHSPSRPIDSRQWRAEVTDVNHEDFVGDFQFASSSALAGYNLQDLVGVDGSLFASVEGRQTEDDDSAELTCVAQLARSLNPTLLATLLDCAPAVFSPSSSPSETELQTALVVCRILRSLYNRILGNSSSTKPSDAAEADLQGMLSHLSPYFPFTASGTSTARRDVKLEQAFQDLNLIYCELSSYLVLASPPSGAHRSKRGSGKTSAGAPAVQIERVSAYIVQLLRGEAHEASLPRPISPTAYVSLLPTVWSLLNTRAPELADSAAAVFTAVLEHATHASSQSATKRHTVDFVGRLVLLEQEAEYRGAFRAARDGGIAEWLLALPKTLWELGATQPAASETIARLLLRLCQRRSRFLSVATLAALRGRLVPFFVMTHPSRGKLPGPFAKLPAGSALGRLMLDLAVTARGGGQDDGGLADAVTEAVQGRPSDAAYWTAATARP